jgi:hypothetical protein
VLYQCCAVLPADQTGYGDEYVRLFVFSDHVTPLMKCDRNYAICVAGFIGLFSLSWWWLGARKYVRFFLSSLHSSLQIRTKPHLLKQQIHRSQNERHSRGSHDRGSRRGLRTQFREEKQYRVYCVKATHSSYLPTALMCTPEIKGWMVRKSFH